MNLQDIAFLEKPKFRFPFSCLAIGATQAGKTDYIFKLIENNKDVFDPPFEKVIYSYLTYQKKFDQFTDKVEFVQGVALDLLDRVHDDRTLYVCDDLMSRLDGNFFVRLMTTARHNNLSVIVMLHDMYFKGKNFTAATRSATHLILFGNPRDKSAIKTLSYQINPSKPQYLYSAWEECAKVPYNPLIVDLLPSTPEELRLLCGLLPGEICYAHLPA